MIAYIHTEGSQRPCVSRSDEATIGKKQIIVLFSCCSIYAAIHTSINRTSSTFVYVFFALSPPPSCPSRLLGGTFLAKLAKPFYDTSIAHFEL